VLLEKNSELKLELSFFVKYFLECLKYLDIEKGEWKYALSLEAKEKELTDIK